MSDQRKNETISALQDQITQSSMKFTCSMMNSLVSHDPEQNVIFSPVSLYTTLALVYFGATGKTRREVAEIMNLPSDIESQELLDILSEMLLAIRVVMEKKGKTTRSIDIQNQLFIQTDTNLMPSYLSHIETTSGYEISTVDFESDPENATHMINDCVSRITNGIISQCIDEPLKSTTHMVFASCINLNLIWKRGFRHQSTKSAKFHTFRGDINVQMMQHQTDEKLPYIDLPDLQIEALEIPFEEKHESIYIILPKAEKSIDDVISSLDFKILQQIINGVVPASVNVNIPSLNLACAGNLYEAFRKLGMNEAFNEDAQLNNMTTDHSLRVSKIIHAIHVEFHERKMGALAKIFKSCSKCVTPSFARCSTVTNPIQFDINRPFLFFIYHHVSKSILFIGAIRNPVAES